MRFGFSKDGGFVVVDDEKRIGEFAYRSSLHANAAIKNAKKTAAKMLAGSWDKCPDHIREAHYEMSCRELAENEPAYWAYAAKSNRVVLVRCNSADDAELERGRLRMSDATTIGSITRNKVAESEMRLIASAKGWAVEAVRKFSL